MELVFCLIIILLVIYILILHWKLYVKKKVIDHICKINHLFYMRNRTEAIKLLKKNNTMKDYNKKNAKKESK